MLIKAQFTVAGSISNEIIAPIPIIMDSTKVEDLIKGDPVELPSPSLPAAASSPEEKLLQHTLKSAENFADGEVAAKRGRVSESFDADSSATAADSFAFMA